MNKKHFLIVLVMVAVASASLFGGFQAYRYNRSMMNKSVFSNNIEAQADFLELFKNKEEPNNVPRWYLERVPCLGNSSSSGSGNVSYQGIGAGGSGSSNVVFVGESLICEDRGPHRGELCNCFFMDCFGRIWQATLN